MKLMNINFLSDASDTNKKPDKYFLLKKNIPELFKDRFIYDSLDRNKILKINYCH